MPAYLPFGPVAIALVATLLTGIVTGALLISIATRPPQPPGRHRA